MLYTAVSATLMSVLLFSLFYSHLRRTSWFQGAVARVGIDRWSEWRPAPLSAEEAELQQTIRVPRAALVASPSPSSLSQHPPPRFTVDDEASEQQRPQFHSHSPRHSSTGVDLGPADGPVPGSASNPDSQAPLPSVWHALQLGARALCLSRDGCHLLKPCQSP